MMLLFTGSFLSVSSAQAFFIGSGLSNVTSGRVIPGVSGSVGTQNFLVSGYMTGLNTDVHYHSAYQLGLLWNTFSGKLLGRSMEIFAGPGFNFSKHGVSNVGDTQIVEHSDFVWGIAIRNEFKLLGPIAFYTEVLMGIEGLAFVFNNFRTTA